MPTDPHEKKHRAHLATIAHRIKALYATAATEAARLGANLDTPQDQPFTFDHHPHTKRQAEKLLRETAAAITTVVEDGIKEAWHTANQKNDTLVASVKGHHLTAAQAARYLDPHTPALEAFTQRKNTGMNLSRRIWQNTHSLRNELEAALSLTIGQGKSAGEISREIRQYLNHPDKLFRRLRDKHGHLHLSQAATAYHPGRGRYRSSYKNALRLAITETNAAYRTADHLRHQDLDFIVGIEICLSANHPVYDICDELAGRYPKTFHFTGWHPHCRCYVKTILKTKAEMQADARAIMHGREPSPSKESQNAQNHLPPEFQEWADKNRQRIEQAQARGTLPYFIRDNKEAVDALLKEQSKLTTAEKANIRHKARTPEQAQAIQKAWDTRRMKRRRKEIAETAKRELKGTELHNPDFAKPITITTRGIKEWLNQPHKQYEAKNEMLTNIKEVIQKAKYVGSTTDKHKGTTIVHIFEIIVGGDKSWLIVREFENGEIHLHSITDSSNILNDINKNT